MVRQKTFNNSKRRNEKNRGQKRNAEGNSFVKCDPVYKESCMMKSGRPLQKQSVDSYKLFVKYMSEGKTELQAIQLLAHHFPYHQALQADETRSCTYCTRELEEDEVNIDDMCNQLCCNSCLFCPTRSASWWGSETDFTLEEEASICKLFCAFLTTSNVH